MYLLDKLNKPVDAEFSLDLVENEPCVVVESSGGSNPIRGVKRRNPDYNKLLSILFSRLADSGIRITKVVLDSERVTGFPVPESTITMVTTRSYNPSLHKCRRVAFGTHRQQRCWP